MNTGLVAHLDIDAKVRAGLLNADWPYTVNAVSGYSGGGNALIDRFERDTDIAFRAYGLRMGHKHLAEMQAYARLAYPPVFSPAVVPAFRGMIVDVPLPQPLDYRLVTSDALAGQVCVVPVGRRSRMGLIVDTGGETDIDPARLKDVGAVVDQVAPLCTLH